MKRKETYLSRDFRETAAQHFPARAKELNTAFDMRLSELLAENADASKEKQYHLKRQILPGISAYETLQRVMPKEEARQAVCGSFSPSAPHSRERATNSLPPCCTYRGFTALFPAFSSSPPGAFSARRRALPQKNCRPVTASGVWI